MRVALDSSSASRLSGNSGTSARRLSNYQSGLIESGSEYAARADAPRRGSAGGFTCVEDTRLDVVFGGSADCFARRGSDRLSPQELAIAGPAAYPIAAPATAPMGPNTTAPETAPSAASPTRSSASAADGTHQTVIAAAMMIFFMTWPSPQMSGEHRLLLHLGRSQSQGQSSAMEDAPEGR